jgi:YVTN family beta-propeller protein
LLTRRALLLAPAAAAVVGCSRRRGSGFDGYAFIANEGGQALAVVDLNTFTLAHHIPLEANPTSVLAAGTKPVVYALTPSSGALYEVGTASLTRPHRIGVARTAVSMRSAPDQTAIWVLARQPRELVRVGLDGFRVESRIALPLDPVDFDVSSDGEAAVVSFGDAGSFGLVDLRRRVCRVYSLPHKVSLARFRSDGRQVLIAGTSSPVLSIADAHSGRTVVHLPLAVTARNLCVKSDGGQLFITGDGMDAVVVVYPYSTEVAETALAGRAPGYMAECASEESDYLFVANPPSGEVTIVDIETRRVIAVVAVGRGPAFITPTPDSQYVLVLNTESGDMAVIRLGAIAAKRDRSAPLFTMVPVGSRPVGAAVRHT